MQKTAQERGVFNNLRELINKPGAYFEGFFRPEMDRIMTRLKEMDDKIRAVLTGKQIGKVQPSEGGQSAKDLLKDARKNLSRREYMMGLTDLGLFHQKMLEVSEAIREFNLDVNKIHHKFLFEGLDEKQQEKLKKFREHMERKASVGEQDLFKEAGLMDFFHNIGTKRGLSLSAWEKRYPKKTKELREGGIRLIDQADALLDRTISYLKQMATARAIRRPDDYMSAAGKIKAEFDKFDKGFRTYYNEVVLPTMKIKDEIEAKEQAAPTSVAPTGTVETPQPPSPPAPPAPPSSPAPATMGINPPGASPPFVPPPPDTDKSLPPIHEKPKTEEAKFRVAHQTFFKSLESMAQEDPRILAGYISKYAASIKTQDPDTAIRLFVLVQQIKG